MEDKCPWGCIFDGDRLEGDCRMPESDYCYFNKQHQYEEAEYEVDPDETDNS